MRLLSLETDLIFPRFLGEVLERPECLVIRTPSNPHYHWGNFLLFSHAPRAGDVSLWPVTFQREFGDLPSVDHMAFTWDKEESGDFQEFVRAGFTFETNVVLAAKEVHLPRKHSPDVIVRPILTDRQWEEVLASQILLNEGRFDPADFGAFKRRQMSDYRRMTQASKGQWFGAYLGETLVGNCGLFHNAAVGRFQTVGTHPHFRRRGVCGTLVFEVARYGFKQLGLEKLVMVADAEYHAAKVYESVGFEPVQKSFSLSKW